jgi:hypothetical protein
LSHAPERKEKVCLNCSADLHGLYCHRCGQQNVEPKESVWGLITHFFYDITHFDGKFFSTLKYLAIRPGFLSAEYIKGRRASYLNPIRMYIFTSALFFIIFFSVTGIDNIGPSPNNDDDDSTATDSISIARARAAALKFADTKADSQAILKALNRLEDSLESKETKLSNPTERLSNSKQANTSGVKGDTGAVKGNIARTDDDDTADVKPKRKKKNGGWAFKMTRLDYKTVEQYDSVQNTLPPDKRDNWFERLMTRRQIVLKKKYGDDGTTLMKAWLNAFFHQFPKLLFVSLPIFALILRLLYIRRKQFYYVDHGIFSIHIYIFSFIVLLISMGLSWLSSASGWSLFDWLQLPLWLYLIYYDYKAMRNFYGQGTGKTLVKFILLNVLAQITIIILFAVFFIFAAFQL